jgi:hypothetical protein
MESLVMYSVFGDYDAFIIYCILHILHKSYHVKIDLNQPDTK